MTHSIFSQLQQGNRDHQELQKKLHMFFIVIIGEGSTGEGRVLLKVYIFSLSSLLYFRFSFVFALTSKFIRINTIRWLFLRNFFIHAHIKKPKRKTNKKRFVVTMRSLIALLTSKRDLCVRLYVWVLWVCVFSKYVEFYSMLVVLHS